MILDIRKKNLHFHFQAFCNLGTSPTPPKKSFLIKSYIITVQSKTLKRFSQYLKKSVKKNYFLLYLKKMDLANVGGYFHI